MENGDQTQLPSQGYTDTNIAVLPRCGGWAEPLRLYQNFWIPESKLRRVILLQSQFKSLSSDIILSTQPKCGTTWLKALAFSIMNRRNYSFSGHPLLNNRANRILSYMEAGDQGDLSDLDSLAPPRLFATHMPYSMLPDSVKASDCKIIYLCRDPKDVFVSRWFFDKQRTSEELDMGHVFELYSEGVSPFGPLWDHNLEYWRESRARPDKFLFLKYEDMVSDPVGIVRKLAEFLGFPFSDEEERNGVVEEIVRLCSFEKMREVEVKDINLGKVTQKNISLLRNGKVGDWVNHLSIEMGEKLDSIVAKKLGGSGLSF